MRVRKLATSCAGAFLAVSLVATPATAQVDFLGPGAFTPDAPAITFDNLGLVNPSFNFLGIPGLGDVQVDFGGHFIGQNTFTIPSGAVSLTGSPTGPLALDPAAPETFITGDRSNPTSPVLSGSPTFNGPISILFSQPVAAVGLDGGFFDAVESTFIEAFDMNGNSLGSVMNTQTGIEFFGVVTETGLNEIAGISFFITENEPAGFAIDNVTFGAAEQLAEVPEPLGITLLSAGLLGLAFCRRRRKDAELMEA